MKINERKHYIDNLRWIILLILIPYHTSMAWNCWGEPNYINFKSNRLISSIVVFFSPYFMPVLFVLAGVSTKLAFKKRSCSEYIAERLKRLFIPMIFGTLTLMPVMSYIGDRFNNNYKGGFFRHYRIFFTKFTDLTGADGGFSFGQFWFLLYLLIISVVCTAILTFLKLNVKTIKAPSILTVILLGIPLPLLSEILSVGGKSFAEYAYLFMIGYFVFSNENMIDKLAKNVWIMLAVGVSAAFVNVYLFIWSESEYDYLNLTAKYISEWFMISALFGLAKKYLNSGSKKSSHMSHISFEFYIWHFIWVVLFEYIIYSIANENSIIIFFGTILLSYIVTFVCCEISIRVPFLCFVTGVKYIAPPN